MGGRRDGQARRLAGEGWVSQQRQAGALVCGREGGETRIGRWAVEWDGARLTGSDGRKDGRRGRCETCAVAGGCEIGVFLASLLSGAGRALQLFFDDVLEYGFVERQVGNQGPQATIFVIEAFEALGFGDFQPPKLLLSAVAVEGLCADSVFSSQFDDR